MDWKNPFSKSKANKSLPVTGTWGLDIQAPFSFNSYNPNFGKKFNSEILLKMYNTVGAVNAIINFIGARCSELPIQHVRYLSNGKKKVLGETPELKRLQNPNEIHTQNTYLSGVYASVLIHGNAPIWKFYVPGFDEPQRIELMPATNIFAIPLHSQDQFGTPLTGTDQRFNELKYYNYLINGKVRRIELEEIIYIRNSNPNRSGSDWYYGMSPLYAAIRNVDILSGIYDTVNTVTQYKGALGFIKKIARAGQIDHVMEQSEKDKTEEKLLSYGTRSGQRSVFVTPYDLAWVRMDSPLSDFMPVEMDEKQFGHLCNQFMIADVLLNSKLASTYNNVKEAEIKSYQNCFMPLVSNVLASHSRGFGMAERNEWFEADYSGVACLQEDEKLKFEAAETKRAYYQNLYDAGLITKNQILSGLDMQESTDPSFNELKNEQTEINTAADQATESDTETATNN
jgi:hypothetical protein